MRERHQGFGMVEVLIAMTIFMFAFLSFYLVMSKSITVAGKITVQSNMSFEVDNRVQMYLITHEFNLDDTNLFHFTEHDGVVTVTDQRYGLSKQVILGEAP